MSNTKKSTADLPVDASSSDLLWPPPAADADILWLDAAHGQPAGAGQGHPTGDGLGSPAETGHAHPAGKGDASAAAATQTPVAPAATPKRVQLSALLAGGVALDWHDAVAIVQQLANDIAPDVTRPPVGSLPDLESIFLDANGSVHASLDSGSHEPMVAALGRLLRAMLKHAPAPANLCTFAQDMANPAKGASLRHWTSQLARWERPDRRGKLKSLYERSRKARPAPRMPDRPAVAGKEQPAPRAMSGDTRALEPEPRGFWRDHSAVAVAALAALACMMLGSIITLLLMGRA